MESPGSESHCVIEVKAQKLYNGLITRKAFLIFSTHTRAQTCAGTAFCAHINTRTDVCVMFVPRYLEAETERGKPGYVT